MGIALLAFSSLSQPVKALTQFFARPSRGASPSDALPSNHVRPAAGIGSQQPAAPSGQPVAAANAPLATPAPVVFSSGFAAPAGKAPVIAPARCLSTVRLQQVPSTSWVNALPAAPAQAANADRFHAGTGDYQHGSALKKERPTLRVMRRIHATDPAKLVISGRMADVCAELDRLAASEAQLAV